MKTQPPHPYIYWQSGWNDNNACDKTNTGAKFLYKQQHRHHHLIISEWRERHINMLKNETIVTINTSALGLEISSVDFDMSF